MASKQSPRKGTPQRQTRGAGPAASTPVEPQPSPPGSSSRRDTPERPLSPGLLVREDEKKQLTTLNNRLARYIDAVNRLQTENQRLQTVVRRVEEQSSSAVTEVKVNYQREIGALRTLLDDETQRRAAALADADNLAKQVDLLKNQNAVLQGDYNRNARRVEELEKENADLKARAENFSVQLSQRSRDLAQIKKQLEDGDKALKAATVENATLRAKLDSARDENKFLQDTHQQEMRHVRVTVEEERSEIDGRVEARYNDLLAEKIEEFRRVYELEKSEMRRRHEQEMEDKLGAYVPAEELAERESRVRSLTQELLVIKNELAEKRRMLDQEREWAREQMREKDTQIAEINMRFRELKKEFDDLLDIKDSMQKELDTYRTLLEQEESRLNISAQSSSQSTSARSPSILSSRKRQRLSAAFESTEGQEEVQCVFQNNGPLKVVEHDAIHGKYVILENTSEEDISLGGWRIVHRSGDVEASHKFPQRFRIRANSKITLWSSDSGATHSPPNDFVLKNIRFPSNENQNGELEVTTELYNADDEEMAKRVSKQQRSATTTTRRFQTAARRSGSPHTSRVSFAPGEVFHHADTSAANLDDSRCAIM